ncbi:MAG: CGNR zinc finger domain-containing protein [Woeseia sp.]
MTAAEWWFDQVIDFANASDLEQAIARLDGSVAIISEENNKRWQLQFPYVEDVGSSNDVNEAHQNLTRLLAAIVKRGATRAVWTEVAKAAVFNKIRGTAAPGPKPGAFKAIATVSPDNLVQWYGFALAELIAEGYGDRVKQCALDTCNNFFVDRKAKGPPRQFCSPGHGSQMRVKRKRQRDARR